MYKKANLTVSHFDTEDVITTSGVAQPDAPEAQPQPIPQPQPQPQPGGQNGESENFPV